VLTPGFNVVPGVIGPGQVPIEIIFVGYHFYNNMVYDVM